MSPDSTLDRILDQNAELRVMNARLQGGIKALFDGVAEVLGTTFPDGATSDDLVAAVRDKLAATAPKDGDADKKPTPIKAEA